MNRLNFPIALFIALGACNSIPPEFTKEQLSEYQNPSVQTRVKIDAQFPAALQFFEKTQEAALKLGRSLTQAEITDAKAVGVTHPEKIRIYVTGNFPIFTDPVTGKKDNQSRAGAMAMGYGIFIKPKYSSARWVKAHEFVHVRQFETLGPKDMIRQVLLEKQVFSNNLIPTEREAIEVSEAYIGKSAPKYAY
ncbi:hypothetical protein ACFOWX_10505 [Sphingorhabdus arenilitoris]|uniref:DUF4157 domain-containing protein n=1 Tax=Sphingorhabdus arenilitoris TaxID=1490041 RepID=A0ABV8RHI1_9SPHN